MDREICRTTHPPLDGVFQRQNGTASGARIPVTPDQNTGTRPAGRLFHAAGRTLLSVLAALLLLTGPGSAQALESADPPGHFTSEELQPLLDSLVDLGFQRGPVESVLYDPRLKRMDRVVRINSMNPDGEDLYKDFTSPYAIMVSKRFLKKHLPLLKAVEADYGVPKEIIVGILLVETQFGRAKLPYRVLDVFTTLAVDSHPKAVDRHYRKLSRKHPDLDKNWLQERIQKKAEFGFQELAAFLAINWENLERVFHTKGSYAGALGMPQFLPSSYLMWGADGDGDGEVDLNQLEDSVASVANYLQSHGWVRGAALQKQWDAVFSYNRSEHYVRAIFEVAFRLKAPPKKNRRRQT
ncbi:MAG: lytic murein transglycosylase [Deltaproteobacteria bacterium]|nr:lytic murein transglycosylase [Deltaproteobacteria bacterium]